MKHKTTYYERHKEERKAYQKAYAERNKGKIKSQDKDARKANYERNKEKRKAYQKVYYAKLKETQEIKTMPIKRSQPKSEVDVDYAHLPWQAEIKKDGTFIANAQSSEQPQKKGNKYLQDNQGNNSSKRLWGSIILGLGVFLGLNLFYFSLFVTVKDSSVALRVVEAFLAAGSALLGFGVFEHMRNKKRGK